MFELKFIIKDGRIATKMASKNMQIQEKLGLLDIAKQQLLDEVKKTKRDLFRSVTKDE